VDEVYEVDLEDLPGENDVLFTQFLRPDRERRAVWIVQPPEVARLAQILRLDGYRFEIEELTTGEIDADVSNDVHVLANFIGSNGPQIPGLVEDLIRRAYRIWVTRGASA
jgi:hypothetical protein